MSRGLSQTLVGAKGVPLTRFRVSADLLIALAFLAFLLAPQAARGAENPPYTSFLDNGVIKVGIDANNGGAISYLSQAGSTTNLINTFDRGREVQQSYYAGSDLDRLAEGQHPSWSPCSCTPSANRAAWSCFDRRLHRAHM
jgi:hypothetical protein